MGELRQYRYREVPGRKKQYASSLLSDHYLAVLSTVRSVHQRKPQRADAGAGMPEVLRKQAFLYPEHLRMMGRYNSLFGMNLTVLQDPETIGKMYELRGIDRIVVNLL